MHIKKFIPAGFILSVCLSVILISCGPNDKKLAENVKSSVSVVDPNIQVSVADGVVTLSGEAKDETSKDAAANAAKEIKGVKSVVNNVTLPAVDIVQPTVTINADDMIRKSVDSAFSAKNLKGVNVSVANGEVTLTGDVKRADLTKVMQAANEAHPKKVINQLTIK